jgi:hypothetical protein
MMANGRIYPRIGAERATGREGRADEHGSLQDSGAAMLDVLAVPYACRREIA